MKISAQQAIDLLKGINPDSEILMWYRTKEDMNCSDATWKKIEDDSQGLEEVIDEYVSGWIEEANED
jgi:hypothetical protein